MESNSHYLIAANALLLLHALFVVLVVFGLLLFFIGKLVHWRWVRNFWLRLAHLAAIAIVVLQSWLGIICPLTVWEMGLRSKAGGSVYGDSFIAHWVQTLLYYDAPGWVFTLFYSIFGALVVIAWYWVRPQR